ncbi:glutamyl-tRNA amidotransferase [[Pantoea] beijingensis]|uniref:Glutamyl-tRNA amidotransferase n=1 Tax=[Pantoea] beijingensis TaxID=1324864 RepID=A0A443IE90_9GAMM|nr:MULTISPECIES: amidase family protein [Erwiniaceae]RWR02368.1 glutamyl-tRNA amidotransferase [[Pantoea] beijingensis]
MRDILDTDALQLAALIKCRELSAVEVVQASIARMQLLEPTLHAFCTPTTEQALADAQQLDKKLARGEDVGALAGVPIAVKDLISTAGVKTTSGSFIYQDFIPDEDDIVVERVRQAGAIILGKTTAPEFGYSGVGHNPLFESPRNPWNTALTPGGSSAGSGVALAARMCPLALGSDGGGSVRIPAAHCGVYGFKASMGRVPLYPGCRDERYPGVSSWESLEHIGPMTRSVADAALMMSVIAGPDMRDRHSIPGGDVDWLAATRRNIKGLRIAYSADWGYAAVDPEVRAIVGRAVSVFERELGCIVEEADPGFPDPREAFMALVAMDTDLVGMRRLMETYGDKMSPHLVAMLRQNWSAEDFTNAITTRKAVTNSMWRFMQRYDLLITPTLATPPFPLYMQGPEIIDGRMVANNEWLAFCFPLNLTGQPAASLPAGLTSSGLPVGLQLVGRHLDDATVLAASALFEQAQPWIHHKPAVLQP